MKGSDTSGFSLIPPSSFYFLLCSQLAKEKLGRRTSHHHSWTTYPLNRNLKNAHKGPCPCQHWLTQQDILRRQLTAKQYSSLESKTKKNPSAFFYVCHRILLPWKVKHAHTSTGSLVGCKKNTKHILWYLSNVLQYFSGLCRKVWRTIFRKTGYNWLIKRQDLILMLTLNCSLAQYGRKDENGRENVSCK